MGHQGLHWPWPQLLLVLVQVNLLLKGQKMVMGPVPLSGCRQAAAATWQHCAPCVPQGWDTVLCPLTWDLAHQTTPEGRREGG